MSAVNELMLLYQRSMLSSQVELQARQAVLDYFDADSDQYMVVFTSNASAGLKLVAEAYPFGPGRALILSEDSHNSLHGMRKYASQASAQTIYYEVLDNGLVNSESFEVRVVQIEVWCNVKSDVTCIESDRCDSKR